LSELWKSADYTFVDRRKNLDKCCFILAGYKEFLWDCVFERIEKFVPADVDVCILSSGIWSDRLSLIAEKNSWSYLATKVNSVTLVQNIAFAVYKYYKWVYKIDEDIFVTEGAFEHLMQGYREADSDSEYEVGISAPLIPVNGYGYRSILKKFGEISDFEDRFGKIKAGGNPIFQIEKNPECAVYMWDKCPQLDIMNRSVKDDETYMICGVRFSIGFILMQHLFWENMQGFTVSGNPDMGTDEEELCASCINRSKAIIVNQNTVVGHFSFGRQTCRMQEYFNENKEWFTIH
jgi:hypothetical protein